MHRSYSIYFPLFFIFKNSVIDLINAFSFLKQPSYSDNFILTSNKLEIASLSTGTSCAFFDADIATYPAAPNSATGAAISAPSPTATAAAAPAAGARDLDVGDLPGGGADAAVDAGGGEAQVRCEFCGQQYRFDAAAIAELFHDATREMPAAAGLQ